MHAVSGNTHRPAGVAVTAMAALYREVYQAIPAVPPSRRHQPSSLKA